MLDSRFSDVILVALFVLISIQGQIYPLCSDDRILCVEANPSYPCDNCLGNVVENVWDKNISDANGNHTIYLVGSPGVLVTHEECATLEDKETPENYTLPISIEPYPGHMIKWTSPPGGCLFMIKISNIDGWVKFSGSGGYLEFESRVNTTLDEQPRPMFHVDSRGQIFEDLTIRNVLFDKTHILYIVCSDALYGVLVQRVKFESTEWLQRSILFACQCDEADCATNTSFTNVYGQDKRIYIYNNSFTDEECGEHFKFIQGTVEKNYFSSKTQNSIVIDALGNYGTYIFNNVFYYPSNSTSAVRVIAFYYKAKGVTTAFYEESHFRFYNNLIIDEKGLLDTLVQFVPIDGHDSPECSLTPDFPLLFYNNVIYSPSNFPLASCDSNCSANLIFDYNHFDIQFDINFTSAEELSSYDICDCFPGSSVLKSELGDRFNTFGPINITQAGSKPFPFYDLVNDLPGMIIPSPDPSIWSLPSVDYEGRPRPSGPDSRTSKGSLEFHCPSSCFGVPSNSTTPCSGHGQCVDLDVCYCDPNYYGGFCNVSTCYGLLSNDSTVCSDQNGECVEDNCECYPNYYGIHCNVTKCYGVFNNLTDDNTICSSHGTCVDFDVCECEEYYYDVSCNYSSCFGVLWNNTEYSVTDDGQPVCSGHGKCEDYNYCVCEEYYEPPYCNSSSCFGVPSNDSENVCSGHGMCYEFDLCLCDLHYYGVYCNVTTCYGVFSNDSISISCSGHGSCSGVYDECDCVEDYYGRPCNITTCFEHYSNVTSSVCSGHGLCVTHDICSCTANYTHHPNNATAQNCSAWLCDGFYFDDPDPRVICSGHGNCTSPETCDCLPGYNYSSKCDDWYCYEYLKSDVDEVCDTHGACEDIDSCVCDSTDYTGSECDIFTCFNISSKWEDIVCDTHGRCLAVDSCLCTDGYSGHNPHPCSEWYCFGIHFKITSSVCSGKGDCEKPDYCFCRDDYQGINCETWSCGVDHTLSQTCSSHGTCEAPNQCDCSTGYAGDLCEINMLYYTVMTPILSVSGLIGLTGLSLCFIGVYCCFVCCLCLICLMVVVLSILGLMNVVSTKKMKKFGKLRDIDILLREQEADDDSSIAHLRVNNNLFEIPYEEIKVDKILGEGGSNSVVFKAFWRNRIVAFKCFKTRYLCATQDNYDEFEREVQILASISHPHIIRFFGATMNPPRVGIVMEFCEHGDLEVFVKEFQMKYGIIYPANEKIRMIHEVITAMDYLHSRNVIHRDIKLENVLVDSQMSCKLMDFGLSRMVQEMDVQKTKNIGTSFYMSPEIVTGEDYTEKCDVFSFSIFIYILITENFFPYGPSNTTGIEMRVASDPTLRPDIEKFRENLPESFDWLCEVVTVNWDHKPDKRWSFSQMSEFFVNHDFREIEGEGKGVDLQQQNQKTVKGGMSKGEDELRMENEQQRKEIEELREQVRLLRIKLEE